MSVLEKIRNKTALLVGIIGLALLIFVLQSALETGHSLFGTDERTVGRIAGKNIDYNDFTSRLNTAIQNYEQNGQKVDDQVKQTLVDQVWNELISEHVLKVAYKKAGVSVGEDELYDLMVAHPHQIVQSQLTDRQTGKVYPNFAKADGSLDPVKLQSFIQQMSPDQERYWKKVEDYVHDSRLSEKYNNLLKKGLYVTTAEAKDDYARQNTKYDVEFVAKRYSAVSDSAISVTEDELKTYYSNNSFRFQNFETTRKIEYVTFDAFATPEDIDEIKNQMVEVAAEFKSKKTLAEDSALMQAENENNIVDIGVFKKGMISPEIDSSVYTAPKGTVFGPFQENNLIKVVKLLDKIEQHDSAKVRHILISYAGAGASPDVKRTKDQAKKLADSLLAILKKDIKRFPEFVQTYSDDGGKKLPPDKKEGDDYPGKGGNYGWMNDNTGFVEPFKNFGLQGKKGDLDIVETNFGYHIMEILDVSKGMNEKFKLATISRRIQPTEKTLNTFNLKASEFAGKYNTSDLFEKGIEEQKLNKRLADNIRENDKQIPGLENPKELVRWAYAANKGDVSPVFQFGNRFVVAKLSEIKEKGIAPYEQVIDDVTMRAKQEKKAQQFLKEFTDYLAAAKTPAAMSDKMKLPVEKANDLVFNSYSVAGLGKEDPLCGALPVLKQGVPSKPLRGMNSVYVVWLTSKKEAPPVKDYDSVKKTAGLSLASRAEYEAFEAMKTMAGIEDHKAKFDF